MRSNQEIAEDLVCEHYKDDSNLELAFYVNDDDKVVKILEVSRTASYFVENIDSFKYQPHVSTDYKEMELVLISNNDYQKILDGTLNLPEGWKDNLVPIEFKGTQILPDYVVQMLQGFSDRIKLLEEKYNCQITLQPDLKIKYFKEKVTIKEIGLG